MPIYPVKIFKKNREGKLQLVEEISSGRLEKEYLARLRASLDCKHVYLALGLEPGSLATPHKDLRLIKLDPEKLKLLRKYVLMENICDHIIATRGELDD